MRLSHRGFAFALVLASCGGPVAPPQLTGARLRVLGTAQDGGLPHAACTCERCEAAAHNSALARHIASLAILDGDDVYLTDATPDVRAQLAMLRDVRPGTAKVDRAPLSGVLLTHAHIGHYLGLAFFGFEAVSTNALPVHATPKMNAFLRENGPWGQLVSLGNIELHQRPAGTPYRLGTVTVTPVEVPHRNEYADTVAFRFEGPRHTILYMPDTEPFAKWTRPFESILEGVDVALLDGTFYSSDELPGRAVSEIGHPLIVDTMDRLQSRVDAGTLKVHFTHFNHSNPAVTPNSAARRAIEARGFRVLEDGQELAL